jgi:hypothetical protein
VCCGIDTAGQATNDRQAGVSKALCKSVCNSLPGFGGVASTNNRDCKTIAGIERPTNKKHVRWIRNLRKKVRKYGVCIQDNIDTMLLTVFKNTRCFVVSTAH